MTFNQGSSCSGAVVSHDGIRVGELGRLVGVPASTLRYYEKVGLLDPAPRSHAGYRIYQPEAIGRWTYDRSA